MRVEIAAFGHFVFLTPEEQQDITVIEKIAKLKEAGKVAVLISGSEDTVDIICKIIKNNLEN
jgi:hypothetical protein